MWPIYGCFGRSGLNYIYFPGYREGLVDLLVSSGSGSR